MNNKYRVAIVDDEALFRRGMQHILDTYEDIDLYMQSSNGAEFMKMLVHSEHPQVVLLDLQMPVMNGIECTKQLQEKYPEIKIVVLSTHYNPSFIINMIELGASAYMPKNEQPSEVALTIRNVVERGFHYNEYVVKLLREYMLYGKRKSDAVLETKFTDRELEVLQLICEQQTTKEIASKLFLSPRTIEGYRNSLLEKTASKNTAGLVIYAIEHGIVKVHTLGLFD